MDPVKKDTLRHNKFFSGDSRPLFIVGAPRSGTTFLHQVINAHPQVLITDELRVISWLFQEAKKLTEGFQAHGNPYPFNNGKELADYLTGNAGTLIRPFYMKLATRMPEKKSIEYWGDKYPHYDEIIDKMAAVFRRGRYVMIHRDLRDVICSVKNGHGWDLRRSAEYTITIYSRYIRKFQELTEQRLIDKKDVFHIAYEQFSEETWKYARIIFDWLNLDEYPNLEQVVEDIREIQSHTARKAMGSKSVVLKFVRPESFGRWERELSRDELKQIEQTLKTITTEIDAAKLMIESCKIFH